MQNSNSKDAIQGQATIAANPLLAAVKDVVSFKYKGGRFVKGEVTSINKNCVVLVLHTDYLGKNVDWYAGETKDFNIGECKNFRVLSNGS